MSARVRIGVWLAIAGGGLALLPTAAVAQAPSTATYVAYDVTNNREEFRWQTVDGATDVTIARGGTVTFTNGANRPHNVAFTESPADPSCQLSTDASPSAPPMPALAIRSWTGTCTFATPGAYRYICILHDAMVGTITVDTAAAPAPQPSPSPGGGTPTPPGPSGGGTPPPTTTVPGAGTTPVGLAAEALGLAGRQTGSRVRASLLVRASDARVIAVVRARRADLGLKRKKGRVEVAQLVRARVDAGRLDLTVRLRKGARKALRGKGTLVVQVRVTVAADGATERKWTRLVTLRAR
jgi:plastocyanin